MWWLALIGCPGPEVEPPDAWADVAVGLDARPENATCVGTREPPTLLSETGCFVGDPLAPAPALIPYVLQAPLWSDAADKERYVALPDGAVLTVDDAEHLVLPPGGVLIKSFALADRMLETRFLVRDDAGDWFAYSYAWADDGSDATLAWGGATLPLDGDVDWEVPSSQDCFSCHTEAAGMSLGLEVAQLHRDQTYAATGRTGSQLATWRAIGLLDPASLPTPEGLPQLPTYDGDAPVGERARAYLHANCAHCHRPGGPGAGIQDLRYTVSLAGTQSCDAVPEFGDPTDDDGRLIVPGEPDRSILLTRMETEQRSWQMPPLARQLVDPQGTALVSQWIAALETCD